MRNTPLGVQSKSPTHRKYDGCRTLCKASLTRQLSCIAALWTSFASSVPALANSSGTVYWKELLDELDGSDRKESAYNAEDSGSIPGLGRSPGEGNGNPLRYSFLENSMDRGAWWATVHGAADSWTQLSN